MLDALLHDARSAERLRPLFLHLGYTADDADAGEGWRAIARWQAFRVLAADAPDPAASARAMARRLAATAQPGLVAATGGGSVAIAAPRLGTPGTSRVLLVRCDGPDALTRQLLRDLAPHPRRSALAHALRVTEVLASETVGERFFRTFRLLTESAHARIPARIPASRRSLLALLPLTRVLFLYFVQAKGWLDGRDHFLREQLDTALARRRHFHRSVLQPLFFGTLNRPRAEREDTSRFGTIPYLNGGLFEPHPAERDHGALVLPNAFWRDAFDRLFDRFRFTVREQDTVDAVAPDMLGQVFERLMHAEDRQRSGTYYTPEQIVREIVVATLATALDDATIGGDVWLALLSGRETPDVDRVAARDRLRTMRVLDPAAGSGAFLLGALDVITSAWNRLYPTGIAQLPGRRRAVLRDQLVGVDVNPVAIRLAELRLWLSVIADQPGTDLARIEPLPNLNGVVRQGDTLLDPLGASRALGARSVITDRAAVASARRAVFGASGATRGQALRQLRQAESAEAQRAVAAAMTDLECALAELERAARETDLFGQRTGLTPAQHARRRAVERQLADVRLAARDVHDGALPFFAFEVHVPDAVRDGGFTAVVGNPPWVRAERLPASLRESLRRRFRWWRVGGGTGYRHQPDLAVAFVERALELTKPGGAVGLLLPSKLLTAGYGASMRAGLVRETQVAYVHRMPDRAGAGFRAAVYPLMLVVRKTPPAPRHHARLAVDGPAAVRQDRLDPGGGPWVLVPDAACRALDRLSASGRPLGDLMAPMLGVKTGADRRLLVRPEDADAIDAALFRPAVRGRDIGPFRATPSLAVPWPYDEAGNLHRALSPAATRWMEQHRSALTRRSDYRSGPPWALFRVAAGCASHRVVWADLARECAAVALDAVAPDAIPLNTCYVAAAPDADTALAVAVTLNSTWIRLLARARADEARGRYRRHNARVMSGMPIPSDPDAVRTLAHLGRAAHHTHDVCQQDLDRAVAEALGLSGTLRSELADLSRDHG